MAAQDIARSRNHEIFNTTGLDQLPCT